MHYAPLAHSTPYNFEQTTLRNLQHAAIWGNNFLNKLYISLDVFLFVF